MRNSLVIWLALLVTAVNLREAHAQLIEGPPGAVKGLFGGRGEVDPNRDSQSFEATFDMSGGYDRDPNAVVIGGGPDAPDLTRGYAGTVDGTIRYRAGSLQRSIEARGRGYTNYQSSVDRSLVGGIGLVNGVARFGQSRLNQLTVQLQSSYEPGLVFGSLSSPLLQDATDPSIGVAPPSGVFEQRWLLLSGIAGYRQHWNRRHVTTFGYENRRLRRIDGSGLDSHLQVASVEQRWAASRRWSVLGSYRFDENVPRGGPPAVLPSLRYQTFDGGLRYERRLSPIKRYAFTLRSGATGLIGSPAAQSVGSWHPSFNGLVEFEPSNRFSVSGEYTRGVTVLTGVSVVPVRNETGELTLAGSSTRKLRYSIATSLARAEFLSTDSARSNSTKVAGATGELRYGVANWAALFASYRFYKHRIDDPALIVSGFPSRYDRHSVRIGLSLWLPLYGTF